MCLEPLVCCCAGVSDLQLTWKAFVERASPHKSCGETIWQSNAALKLMTCTVLSVCRGDQVAISRCTGSAHHLLAACLH